jgi:hypothetical protein
LSKPLLNFAPMPLFFLAWSIGFSIVAQSAGVSTMATTADRSMAETIVTENCR